MFTFYIWIFLLKIWMIQGDSSSSCQIEKVLREMIRKEIEDMQEETKCFSGLARDYVGRKSTTISGLTCQRWDSQSPHEHEYQEKQFPDCSVCGARNYCRDPGDDGYLWCYTTDPNTRWESCGIPWCDEPERNNQTHDCYAITEEDKFYYDSDKKICESKSNRFEVTKHQLWPKCEDCCCQLKDCYKTNCTGCYTGTWHRTQAGHECQRWDAQRPHKHRMHENKMFQKDYSLTRAQNYCRDPSDSGFLWCYTMDPNTRWAMCGIPECKMGAL